MRAKIRLLTFDFLQNSAQVEPILRVFCCCRVVLGFIWRVPFGFCLGIPNLIEMVKIFMLLALIIIILFAYV